MDKSSTDNQKVGIHKGQAVFRSMDHNQGLDRRLTNAPLMSDQDQNSEMAGGLGALHRSMDSKGNPKLVLYSYRWVILAIYSLSIIATGMVSGTCVTIASMVQKIYGLSTFEANFTNLVFYIMYIPANFLSIAILNRYGIKICIVWGIIFTMIGSWIRLFVIFTNYYSFLIGCVIAAIGQPFLMNTPSKIASIWFGDKERAIATAVGSMSVPVGFVISFTLPQAVISGDEAPDLAEKHFQLYLFIQTMIISLFSIPCLVFLREEPPSPPSIVANDTNDMSIREGLKSLVSNKNYVILFFTFIFIYSINASMAAVYSNFATKFHFTLQSNSVACMVFLVGGIFNSFFLGTILDKYQNYKKLVTIICAVSILTNALHFVSLPTENEIFESFTMLLIGCSVIPILSVAQTFAVELAFPVPEALTNGMMMTSQMIMGTAMGIACSSLGDISTYYPLGLWVGLAIIGFILSFFIEQDLRRLYMDDVKNSEYIEEDDLRKQSMEQREVFLKESGLETDLKFRFEFDIDNARSYAKVNKSHDEIQDYRSDK